MPVNPLASAAVVGVGALWGLYWVPLRQLDAVVRAGPWITLAVLVVACVALAPLAWRARGRLRAASNRALASVALGGASFALYSNGLLYGDVAVVILLFYLTPIWSTLIARFWLGWPVSWWRYAAIACGLVGIALVLRGSHGGLPLPHGVGDWLGLASGMLWALASTGIHVHARTGPAETNFVFCLGGAALALLLAPLLAAQGPPAIAPDARLEAAAWTLLIGGFWWALSLSAFMWATRILEPARVGILLMSEVIVGAVSAALLAAEAFGAADGRGHAAGHRRGRARDHARPAQRPRGLRRAGVARDPGEAPAEPPEQQQDHQRGHQGLDPGRRP
ncbi:MAG: DMT family transporter [Halofilum sp. (in: g-proteobacteria)]|nr:DMT family transporter [Halofilum sp. (in: g-proteobacteria)]